MRNRFIILIFLIILGFGEIFAQRKKGGEEEKPSTQQPSNDYQRQEKIFEMALDYGDGVAAKQALYEMMVLKPEKEDLKDSLAMLYFQMGMYPQTLQITSKILETKTDYTLLEMKAISANNMGALKESLEDYETLYKNTSNSLYLYEIAMLQYRLKRYGEGAATTEALLQANDVDSLMVIVAAGRQQNQRVPLLAATYNLRGVMAMELKDFEAAKSNFEQALAIEPKFVLASNNAQVVAKQMEEEAKNPKK